MKTFTRPSFLQAEDYMAPAHNAAKSCELAPSCFTQRFSIFVPHVHLDTVENATMTWVEEGDASFVEKYPINDRFTRLLIEMNIPQFHHLLQPLKAYIVNIAPTDYEFYTITKMIGTGANLGLNDTQIRAELDEYLLDMYIDDQRLMDTILVDTDVNTTEEKVSLTFGILDYNLRTLIDPEAMDKFATVDLMDKLFTDAVISAFTTGADVHIK